MRVAVVDLGTNSTRLLVADVDDGHVEEVARRVTITRLGEGVDERRKLLPLPVARVRNVLADYRRELEELGAERTLALGTSAIRDAENGEAFLGEIGGLASPPALGRGGRAHAAQRCRRASSSPERSSSTSEALDRADRRRLSHGPRPGCVR
jgi:exopolyphosphatase/guanosine-5'-triphosphate,3'-diphosphate pyrophosphatase